MQLGCKDLYFFLRELTSPKRTQKFEHGSETSPAEPWLHMSNVLQRPQVLYHIKDHSGFHQSELFIQL